MISGCQPLLESGRRYQARTRDRESFAYRRASSLISVPPETPDGRQSQQGDLRLSDPPSDQGPGGGARTATEECLQISGRICYPLWHTDAPVNKVYHSRLPANWKTTCLSNNTQAPGQSGKPAGLRPAKAVADMVM
ncbi:hypothetical protein PoB_006608900 [Plakobranchus ocellatus]|uniref:Uncharacterized protein n=1 Tax=Plakobranchus ocellatus TaxID=259542 RepID=A0AAV4D607_9GAST|nr:hypothetical protein PoB_006608900 [Plakobranchus ocellatus]